MTEIEKELIKVALELSEIRIKKGISYHKLSEITKIPIKKIKDIETFSVAISMKDIIKISSALNVNMVISFTDI